MNSYFTCTECDTRIVVQASSYFDENITKHMKAHGCTCDKADDGTRTRCAYCKWFEL